MAVTDYVFGRLSTGKTVKAFILENSNGSKVTLVEYGAAIQSIKIRDKKGYQIDVVLGYDSPEEYEYNDGCLGATIGRFANRINNAEFELNGISYKLTENEGKNHIHGGNNGFARRLWKGTSDGKSVIFYLNSFDGEEGYPGNIKISVMYFLDDNDALHIRYKATTDKDTIINLTNHSYFNLDSSEKIFEHVLLINSNKITEVNDDSIPTGNILNVENTPFDFTVPKKIGSNIDDNNIQINIGKGYDHNYILLSNVAAVLYSEKSGIEMTVETDRPGMQLYTANFLTDRIGKGGMIMRKRSAVCFETQNFPDAINHDNFPECVLRKDEEFQSETVYRFRIR